MRDYIGDYYRVVKGDTRSLDSMAHNEYLCSLPPQR